MSVSSKIKVLASGSKGNCYIIEAEGERLLLECGIHWKRILKGLNFDIRNIVGCLLSHSHKDHCKSEKEVRRYGIEIYTSCSTIYDINPDTIRNYRTCEDETFKIGNYVVKAFQGSHTHTNGESCQNNCYLIYHPKLGRILFATDTYSLGRFKGIDHIMVECNYSESFTADLPKYRQRVIKSHMSLENLKRIISTWDLSSTKDITLLHISSENGDETMFKDEIERMTGIPTYIAKDGLELDAI